MGIYLLGAGTLACAVWSWAGIVSSQDIPHDFYLPLTTVELPVPILLPPCLSAPHYVSLPLCPCSTSLPLLPVWMNVASLNPWLLDFHTVLFSDCSGCYLLGNLVVICFCGCMKRQSMSTYASILTGSQVILFFMTQRGRHPYKCRFLLHM